MGRQLIYLRVVVLIYRTKHLISTPVEIGSSPTRPAVNLAGNFKYEI